MKGKKALLWALLVSNVLIFLTINARSIEYPISDHDYQWKCVLSRDETTSVGDRILLSSDSKLRTRNGTETWIWNITTWYFDKTLVWSNTLKNAEYMTYQKEKSLLEGMDTFYYGEIYFLPESVSLDLAASTIAKNGIYDNNTVENERNLLILSQSYEDLEIRLMFNDENVLINKNISIGGTTYVEWRLLDKEENPIEPIPKPIPPNIEEQAAPWIPLIIFSILITSLVFTIFLVRRHKEKSANFYFQGRESPSRIEEIRKESKKRKKKMEQKKVKVVLRESRVLKQQAIPSPIMDYIIKKGKKSGEISHENLPPEFLKQQVFLCKYETINGEYVLHCYKFKEKAK